MRLQILRNSVCRMVTVAACAAAVAVCAVSCADTGFEGSEPIEAFGSDEIVIAVPELSVPTVSTRVAIESDDNRTGGSLSLKWTENDAFGLWASGGENSSRHKNMEFRYHGDRKYPSGGMVYFASYSVPVMEDDTYNYTAFYPYQSDESKVDRAGNRIVYEIPSVQSGRYEGALDIMSATAEFGEALTPGFYQEIGLNFRHETHILKITVPEGSNDFGYDITRIRIEFPQPVVGELSFDTQTGEADYSGVTGSFVDVKFDTPLNEGDAFWVFVAPSTLDGEVRFTAYGGDNEKYQSEPSIAAAGKFGNLQRAGITPVKLGIKEGFSVTWFDYEIGDWSRLGEQVDNINIKLPDGLRLADRSDEGGRKSVAIDGEGKFRFSFRTAELESAAASGFDLAAIFESEHALVAPYESDRSKFVISAGGYEADGVNSYRIDYAPYLFEEDFESISPFAINDTYISSGLNQTESGNVLNATSLTDNGLDGWDGAKVGVGSESGSENTAMRVGVRIESWGRLSTTIHHGRVDSAPMSRLKDNMTAPVKVSFNYSLGIENNAFVPRFAYGYHTVQNSINAGSGSSPALQGFGNNENLNITGSGGSYALIGDFVEYTIEECTKEHRLAWEAYGDGSTSASNTNGWVYIDNIKVSIVNE